jgi:catechol-2,3-dioxygenase
MPQLRQLVIAAEEPSRLAEFYQNVFELDKIDEAKGAVFLSDGVFNLGLVPEPRPQQQGLKQLSFETVRVESLGKKLAHVNMQDSSLAPVESLTGVEFELRDPDGNAVGLCRRAFDVAYEKRPVPIRHIALYTPNPQRMAEFYCTVFDMKEVEKTDRSSIFVSDGYFNLALLYAGASGKGRSAARRGRREFLLASIASMIPRETASTSRRRAGMFKEGVPNVPSAQDVPIVPKTVWTT